MNENEKLNRRKFLAAGLFGTGAVAAGAAVGWFASRHGATAFSRREREPLGGSFKYDIGDLAKTDPALVRYDETGRIPTGFTSPKCIEIAKDDSLYIGGDTAVKVFDKTGALKTTIATSEKPHAIAIAEDRIAIALKQHIEFFDATGKQISKSESLGDKTHITGIAIAGEQLFIADAGNREIIRCDLAGKPQSRFGKIGSKDGSPGFSIPSAYFEVVIGPEGLLWANNHGRHEIESYTLDGKFELAWGKPSMSIDGFCGCCNPVHFSRLPDGRFITSEKGLNRIKIYDVKGNFEGVVAGTDTLVKDLELAKRACSNCQIGFGFDIACDSQSRVFALDLATRDVRIFTPKQKAVTT